MTRIAFIAPNDWIVAAWHLPMIRAAREIGLQPVVIAPDWGRRAAIEAAGARVVSLPREPKPRSPGAVWRRARQLRGAMASFRPDMLHLIGMGAIVAGSLAARLSGVKARVHVVGGLGLAERGTGQGADALRATLRAAGPALLDGPDVRWLCETPEDAALLGLDPDGPSVRVGGVGVDPLVHVPEPTPWSPPLRLAFVSALTDGKGAGVAVEALRIARRSGAAAELSLFGAASAAKGAIPAATLAAWAKEPGVAWYAPADLAQVWRQHHALVTPGLGGDGLPREILIAAAAMRPAIASDTAGCRRFVRHGSDGLLAPPGDAEALARAMLELARAPGLAERMGRAARDRVVSGFSERRAMEDAKALWTSLLAVGLTA